MKVGLLYSGGKDSSLAAYVLNTLGFDVRLLIATFGIDKSYRNAQESASALGFEHELLRLSDNTLDEAGNIIEQDGYPKNGFTYLHKKVLEDAAGHYSVLADGTRRDDKTPFLGQTDIQSLEDGFGVEYMPMLRGIGHKMINRLCNDLFVIEVDESSKINKGDYEGELRTFLAKKGLDIEKIFPKHYQSRVISWRDKYVEGV